MDYPQALVSIIMVIVFIAVGLPVWWNTTNVYRASLPLHSISKLQNSSFKLKINIKIYTEFEDFKTDLQDIFNDTYHLNISVATVNGSYGDIFDCKYLPRTKVLTYSFYFFKSSASEYNTCRNSFVAVFQLKHYSVVTINSKLKELLTLYLPLSMNYTSGSKKTSDLQLSTGYRINFVLAVANPKNNIPMWNADIAIQKYVDPFLEMLDFLGPFTTSSQVLYYTDFGLLPNFKNGSYYYSKSKLSLLINPLESRLNTYTTSDKTLQFVVYVPSVQTWPLYVRSKLHGQLKLSSAFHIPRWGGIYFYNDGNISDNSIDLKPVFQVFLNQFSSLVGLNAKEFENDFRDVNSVLHFAVGNLKIRKLYEHLQSSISTLVSLIKLLNEISNIVIRDEIAEIIHNAVQNIQMSIVSMETGDLDSAYTRAKEAFICSEKAFFDESLIGLLYFPDDQKYAIYVPLFLPISIPVLLSFIKAIRYMRHVGGDDGEK